jgi:hypothetical protein
MAERGPRLPCSAISSKNACMGMLRDGEWSTDWYEPGKGGAFERPDTKFRGRVTADGILRVRRPRPAAITSTSRGRARGPTAPC